VEARIAALPSDSSIFNTFVRNLAILKYLPSLVDGVLSLGAP